MDSMNTTPSKTEITSSTQEPVVYVVDDMPQVLDVVRMILEKEGCKVITFQSGKEFLAQEEISEIGCVILDNQMPEMTGLDVQAELIERGYSIPIIFVSGASRYEEVVDAVREGALHFLQKPFTHTELTTLVKEAIDESRKRQVQFGNSAKYKALIKNLTSREMQLYQLVTDGLTNRVISEKLDISNGTVEFHRSNMMKKLEAKTLAELMQIKQSIDA
jgi:two-component system, LuxR family, response regulator FixJ